MAGRFSQPRSRPGLRVAGLAMAALLACATIWLSGVPTAGNPVLSPVLPWWVLAALFATVEMVTLHLFTGRESQSITLSEIPLILGLFLAPPEQVLLAVLVGPVLVFLLYLRQPPLKAAFNTTLRALGATLALAAFHLLAGAHSDIGAVRSWLAAVTAVVMAGVVDGLLITAVMRMQDPAVRWRHLGRELPALTAVSVVVACAGLIAVSALHAEPVTGVLLVIVGAGALVGYGAHARVNDQRQDLQRLHHLQRTVSAAARSDEVILSVLRGARDYVRADWAYLVVPSRDGGLDRIRLGPDGVLDRTAVPEGEAGAWLQVLSGGCPLLLRRDEEAALHASCLRGLGHREGIVVPLQDQDGLTGLLAVADRSFQMTTFDLEDVQSLQRVADQARLALSNGRLMERLAYQASHDTLTGLANASTLRAELQTTIDAHARGQAMPAALLLLEIDGFAEISTTLGHHSTDQLLRLLTHRLTDSLNGNGQAARVGDAQFAVLLPDTAVAQTALHTAHLLRTAVCRLITIDDLQMRIEASVGIALMPAHGQDVTELFRAAGAALDAARTSLDRVRLHDRADLAPGGRTTLAFVSDLRAGLHRGQLQLYVQPQALAHSGRIVGVEALARWNHPELGMLTPDAFLPTAERHGLMPDLTRHVLSTAVAAAAGWHRDSLDLTMSVNLSPRSLADTDLVHTVAQLLADHQLPAHLLTLEITEESMIARADAAIDLLTQLRALGVGISVDDYGTGYSSLSYLRRLPATEIKIDRSFVAHMCTNPEDLVIVRSIIDLAANLSLTVVAEGVEDQDTWDRLTALGCSIVQGYHLARPFPIDELRTWLVDYQVRPSGRIARHHVPPQTRGAANTGRDERRRPGPLGSTPTGGTR